MDKLQGGLAVSRTMTNVDKELITVNRFKVNGAYTDGRKEKHKIILTNILDGKVPNHERNAILLGGGSGAGKSTIVKEFFGEDFDIGSEFITIDADEIKTHLDEYKTYINNEDTVYFAAFYVHAESGDIVDMLLGKCIELGLSFIYDGTMSWKPLYNELLPKLKTKSYHTLGMYVDVDIEVAQKRVEKRGKEIKRYVDKEVVRKANRNSAIVFSQLEEKFDEVAMYNNTEERTEDSNSFYKPFYTRDKPSNEPFEGNILNKRQFELFIKKSEEPYLE